MSYWLSSAWLEAAQIIALAVVIAQLPFYVIAARILPPGTKTSKPVAAWIAMVALPVVVSLFGVLPTGRNPWILLGAGFMGLLIIGIGALIARPAAESLLATHTGAAEGAYPATSTSTVPPITTTES